MFFAVKCYFLSVTSPTLKELNFNLNKVNEKVTWRLVSSFFHAKLRTCNNELYAPSFPCRTWKYLRLFPPLQFTPPLEVLIKWKLGHLVGTQINGLVSVWFEPLSWKNEASFTAETIIGGSHHQTSNELWAGFKNWEKDTMCKITILIWDAIFGKTFWGKRV